MRNSTGFQCDNDLNFAIKLNVRKSKCKNSFQEIIRAKNGTAVSMWMWKNWEGCEKSELLKT